MNERIWRVVSLILSFAMVLCLGGVFIHHRAERKANEEKLLEYRNSPVVIEENQDAIRAELEELKQKYEEVKKSILPTMDFFVTDLDESMYWNLYPLMNEFGFKGKLVLTHKQFPDLDGKISKEQFNEMLNAGWSYCIGWDSDTDLADRIDSIRPRLEEYSLAMPDTIFDRDRLYTEDMASILTERGFTTVVVSELKKVISDEPVQQSGVTLYHTATTDKLDVGKAMDKRADEGGGCFSLRLRIRDNGDVVFSEAKTRKLFEKIKAMADENHLHLCDQTSVAAYWQNEAAQSEAMLHSLEDAMAQLETQLAQEQTAE